MFEKKEDNNSPEWSDEHSDWEYRIYLGVTPSCEEPKFGRLIEKYGHRDDSRIKYGKDYYWRNQTDGYLYLKGFSEEEIIGLYGDIFI